MASTGPGILIIDDEPSVCVVLSRMLAAEGFQTHVARTAAEGLRACAELRPALVLLDLNLPDGKGGELCRRLKADPELGHIPVLLMSGGGALEEEDDEAATGADGRVLKPFTTREIATQVREILARSGGPA